MVGGPQKPVFSHASGGDGLPEAYRKVTGKGTEGGGKSESATGRISQQSYRPATLRWSVKIRQLVYNVLAG